MRIHELRAEAFGPFATEVSVDLDALSDAGLFLLTGATGAGKTSVLDAICFALYGAVPGDRQAAKRLRSDHAPEGVAPSVSMEFTVQGRRFHIHRSPAWQRPKKRGAGRTTEQASVLVRERIDGEWRPLSSRLDEAGHLVAGLLGMNLTQFCQVQLLPQGRFQAFLRADSDERHRLLQQLFRTDRFEDVESWLRERRRVLRRDSVRHHETVAALVSRVSEAADELPPDGWDLHALEPVTEHLSAWVESLVTTSGETDAAARQRVAAATAAAAAARESLETGRQVAERQQRLARARAEEAALADDEADHDARERRLEAGRRAAAALPLVEVAERALTDLGAAETLAESRLTRVGALLGLTDPPGDALSALERNALDLAARARAHAPRVVEHDRLQVLVTADETRGADVAAALEAATTRLAEVPDEISLRRTAEDAAARAVEALPGAGRDLAAARDRRDAGVQVDGLMARRLEAEALLRQAVDHAQAATQEWLDLQELRLTGMAAEIAGALAVGASCPVCGSADHPQLAAARPGAPDAEAVRAARAMVDDAEVVRQAHAGAVADLQVQIGNARERAGHLTVPVLEAALAEQQARLTQLETHADALPAVREAREAAERELDELTRRRVELSAESARIDVVVAERRSRMAAIEAEVAALLAGSGHADVAELAAHADAVAEACSGARQALHECERARDTADSATTRSQEEAAARGFESVAEAKAAALTGAELDALEQWLLARRTRVAAVAAALTDPELVAAAEADVVDLVTLEAAEAAADAELTLARDIATTAHHRQVRLARLRSDLDDALAAWAPLRARCDLTDRLASLADGTSPDNRLRMRLSGYVLAFRLRQVVAAANERLVAMTDSRYRLEHTGSRGAGESRGGLSLLVRDDWSGQTRDPVTLSGGETFVVSLALALGLADTIAHEAGGAELDTLFVDEGFGSLDAETLDDVMNTLDSLRDGGRVVGVVSHVAELRDRIPTQLHVRKARGGSTLHQEAVG